MSRAERLDRYREGLEGDPSGEASPGEPLADSRDGNSDCTSCRKGTPDDRDELRELLVEDYGHLVPDSMKECGTPLPGEGIDFYYDDDTGESSFRGFCRCRSPQCPTCAPRRAVSEAEKMEVAIQKHRRNGGEVLFLTLTVPHGPQHSAKEVIDTLRDAYAHMSTGRKGKKLRDQLGYRAMVKRRDWTLSPETGHHAHLHLLWFVEDVQDVEAVEAKLRGRWRDAVTKQDWKAPDERAGVVVERADDPAQYIAKAGLAKEMTDLIERNASGRNVTPWRAMLRVYRRAQAGELVGSRGWEERRLCEYLKVMQGRPPVRWSPGFKGDIGVSEGHWEQTREDFFGADHLEPAGERVLTVTSTVWRWAAADQGGGEVLKRMIRRAYKNNGSRAVRDLLRDSVKRRAGPNMVRWLTWDPERCQIGMAWRAAA